MKFKSENLKFGFKALLYIIFELSLLIIIRSHDDIFEITNKFRNNKLRRCSHQKKSYKKNYVNNFNKYSRKSFSSHYNDIPFEKMRIHFDYTYTLPHEEKILKELVIPPVKNFYENTLSVRRIPGKLRVPKNLHECQEIPIPSKIKKDGVEADLVILISTYRGLKKYNYEQSIVKSNNGTNDHQKQHDKYILKNYLDDFFIKRAKVKNSLKKEEIGSNIEKVFRANLPINLNNDSGSNENVYYNDLISNITSISSNDSTRNASKFSSETSNKTLDQLINNTLLPWEINDGPSDVVGWSITCLQDLYTLRPVLGIMQYVSDIDPSQRAIEEAVWTTLHEFAHILGMDYDLFSDFIDSDMNRKGYEGTLKIKSRLKGLEEIMRNRSEYFDDLHLFASVGGKNNLSNKTIFDYKNQNFKKNQRLDRPRFKQITEKSDFYSTNIKEDNNNKNIQPLLKTRQKANSVITISTHSERENRNNNENNSDKKRIKVKKNNIKNDKKNKNITHKPDQNNTILENLSSENLKNDSLSDFISDFSNYAFNHSYHHVNDNSSVDFNFPSAIELEYNITKISLPLLDEYVEVNFPPNINITTLMLYINNFSEHTRVFMKTENVVSVGKLHFRCQNMDGVELEHFGGLGSAYSHWSKRILNSEFMIADSYGENYLSNFTLALFEDSGWYKVDYSKSEDLLWGKNKGCGFLNEKCIEKKKIKTKFFARKRSDDQVDKYENSMDNYETKFKDEFCLSQQEEKCSISKVFRAFCSLGKESFSKIPKEYQYFDDPEISGENYFGDYCPYPIEWSDNLTFKPIGSCRNGIPLRAELGEKICENCRCFISSLVEENIYEKQLQKIQDFNQKPINKYNKSINYDSENKNSSNLNRNSLDTKRSMCYEAKCRKEGKKVFLIISIQAEEIKCPRNGGILSIEGYKGFIECPPVDSVCFGPLNPNEDYKNTSAYNLFSNLAGKLLTLIYDFISNFYDKREYIES